MRNRKARFRSKEAIHGNNIPESPIVSLRHRRFDRGSGSGARKLEYPAPRYPELREVKTATDLLDIARTVVKRKARGGSGFYPGYGIKPGERVLLAVDTYQDRLIVEALVTAIKEAGGKPDVLFLDYDSFFPPMQPE